MITVKPMGSVEGKDVFLYTLQQGISVDISSYGATITAIRVPDKCGNTVDVAFGTPVLLSALIGHGWQGVVVQIIGLAIATLIYIPFMIVANKQAANEANA